ncbi:MAG: hypothetical protein OEZ68_01625 [Gammaproteobacteria bacterium]|nr:hypothetical protein [Gammaproteobacteria bacterium]MDH5799479.1 hypothetical protein [Gammaproteobacteria bacterium]
MRITTVFLFAIFSPTLWAGSFDATVSPPKFEVKAEPGEVVRQVIQITNMSSELMKFRVNTEDWDFVDNGKVKYHAGTPVAGSCRPWTRIERHLLAIPGKRQRPYRFEIHIPKNTAPTSCHFALVIGPDPKSVQPASMGNVSMPFVGRIAVIIYVTIGSAQPVLNVKSISMQSFQNNQIPVAVISNTGNAHARPSGILKAKDASGRQVELWVGAMPILPQQSRKIPLHPMDWSSGSAQKASFTLTPPIHVQGELEWGDNKTKLDQLVH